MLVKIANTSLDRSAALVLSIINCQLSAALVSAKSSWKFGWLDFRKKWADSRFAGNEIWYNPIKHRIKTNYCT